MTLDGVHPHSSTQADGISIMSRRDSVSVVVSVDQDDVDVVSVISIDCFENSCPRLRSDLTSSLPYVQTCELFPIIFILPPTPPPTPPPTHPPTPAATHRLLPFFSWLLPSPLGYGRSHRLETWQRCIHSARLASHLATMERLPLSE